MTKHFARHYLEMVVAMFLGMVVLGAPAGWAMTAMGTSWSELHTDAPALVAVLAGMLAAMLARPAEYSGHRHVEQVAA